MSEIGRKAESFAKYHREHAAYRGPSQEFHERAATFLGDVEALIVAARVEGFAAAREQAENVLRGRANLWRSDSGPYKVLRDVAELVRVMQDGAVDEGRISIDAPDTIDDVVAFVDTGAPKP